MVFEGFQQGLVVPRKRRSWVFVLSVLGHAGLLLAGIVYSFWHVDELKMPPLTVTFVSGIPQAAPPPPAALGGGANATKSAAKPAHKPAKTPPKEAPRPLVQPEETPKPVAEKPPAQEERPEPPVQEAKSATHGDGRGPPGPGIATGTPGGDPNGHPNGISGGTGTGSSNGPPAPARVFRKFLPPTIGSQQKLAGNDPDFPAVLRRPGARYLVGAKVCVGADGRVESIDIVQAGDPALDANVREAVKATWRYRPFMANGTPVPFCYKVDFRFQAD